MAGRSVNIYLKDDIYQEIKQASDKNVSRLVNEIVSKYLTQKKNKREEELKLKIIAGYKENAQNKKLREELEGIEKSSSKELFKKK